MKAIVCRKPYDIAMEERPIAKPAADEVLVKICRVGICGTDYHIYGGVQPFLEYPRVIGHELSAIVEEAPPSSEFIRGQLVVVNPYLSCGSCHACANGKPNCCMQIQVLGVHRDGGMCERMCLPKDNLIPANGLSADEAASVEFLAIGAHAVHRSGVGPNTYVLVIGAGPIGLGVALFARTVGSHVTIMDRDPGRLALACSVTGINSSILADGSAQEMAAKSKQGNGFDAVFDATGS